MPSAPGLATPLHGRPGLCATYLRLTKPCLSCHFCAVVPHTPRLFLLFRSPCQLGSAQRPSWQPVTPDFNCRAPYPESAPVYASSSGFTSLDSTEAEPSSSAPLYPWHLKKCRAQIRCSINAGGSMQTSRFTQQCLQDHCHASRPGPRGSLAPDSHRHFCCPLG